MKKIVTLVAVVAAQAALVGVAVAPQLSARVTGDTYLFRVAPLDPIDPFRGAYVTLGYPDLRGDDEAATFDRDRGPVYVTLVNEGGVMVADTFQRQRSVDSSAAPVTGGTSATSVEADALDCTRNTLPP